jgi:hypothetical protein
MCPACIATITFAVAGTTSAGGLAALLARKVRGRKSEKAGPCDGAAPHGVSIVATAKGG